MTDSRHRTFVVMGVAGCGKSSLGAALAAALALPLIEGDDHHSVESRAKMSRGIALDDAAAVAAFLRDHAIGYPSLVDTPGPADAGVRLGNPAGVLPYSLLVSAEGRILKTRIGPFADKADIAAWAQRD